MSKRTFAFQACLVVTLLALLLAVGCGRSDLSDDSVVSDDGGTGCTGDADCPTGQTCNLTTHQCVPTNGCGACKAPTPYCTPDTKQCVACLNDTQCPSGDACENYRCVPHCGPGGACPSGSQCCSTLCVDETSDPKNCGACGRSCGPYAHTTATCTASSCGLGRCDVGFADCDRIVQDGCETNTNNDPRNCGACGRSCGAGESCSGGVCVGACGPGGSCPPNTTCCGSSCANTTADPNNCGGCGKACAQVPNASITCATSKCAIASCSVGFADCNRSYSDGCEVNTSRDPNNCGSCGVRCAPGAACVMGVCQTNTGCNGGPSCAPSQSCCATGCSDTASDVRNCGACGNACPPGDSCLGSRCVPTCNGGPQCGPNQTCCVTGCTDTTNDTRNCGACGNACPSGDTCVGSTCRPMGCNGGPSCGANQKCCATGCSDTTTDVRNCGACGNACPAGDTCVGSMCKPPVTCNGGPACNANQTCCPTGCSDTSSDPNNCGGCGVTCGGTTTCAGGSCAVNEGPFNPVVNPTYLTPGVHLFTTINVPAGGFVYVAGGGPASGTLQLFATGAIVIDGTIDVSGGPGTQNTITSRSTNQGKAGSGGFTGEPYASAPASAACEFVAGNGGNLGFALAGTVGSCSVISSTTCITRNDPRALLWAAAAAQYGGGGGVFTGYRAYGGGGGGAAGGAPGALGPAYPGEDDCSGASGGGGAINGGGGSGGGAPYDGAPGVLGQTQCAGMGANVPPAYVGGGGGGSIGAVAANDLAVATTFQTGSSGGGGSADYLNRPVFGGTSGGGGGGGALKLSSPVSITVHGRLLANGGVGGDAFIGSQAPNCDPQPGAAGGGGSGGVIVLASPVVNVASGATVSAAGGAGGFGSLFASGGAGGAGGLGRVRISATPGTCTLNGAFTPALRSGCSATPGGARGFAFVAAYPN